MSKKNFEAIFTVFALFAKNVIFSSNFQSAPISMKFDIWGISDMPQRLVAISCTGGDFYVSGNVNFNYYYYSSSFSTRELVRDPF